MPQILKLTEVVFKQDGTQLSTSSSLVEDTRPELAHRNEAGALLEPVQLYCADTNHVSFKLTGDTADRILVCCPHADMQWTVCAQVPVVAPAAGADPSAVQGAKVAAVVAVSTAVQLLAHDGCPTHDVVPAEPTTTDTLITAIITPEDIAAILAQAGH